jgi:hypothetical protein
LCPVFSGRILFGVGARLEPQQLYVDFSQSKPDIRGHAVMKEKRQVSASVDVMKYCRKCHELMSIDGDAETS